MKMIGKQTGFTLIELVMVIAILGILSAVALPKFQDLQGSAKIAATKGSLGAVRSALAIRYAQSATDGAAATYPNDLAGVDFSDGQVPKNALNNQTAFVTTTATISGTVTNDTAGWWYVTGSTGAAGRAGAFTTGTVNTNDF